MQKATVITAKWRYTIVCMIVLADLVVVSGRGYIDWQSTSFGPKERRKRQGKLLFNQDFLSESC